MNNLCNKNEIKIHIVFSFSYGQMFKYCKFKKSVIFCNIPQNWVQASSQMRKVQVILIMLHGILQKKWRSLSLTSKSFFFLNTTSIILISRSLAIRRFSNVLSISMSPFAFLEMEKKLSLSNNQKKKEKGGGF